MRGKGLFIDRVGPILPVLVLLTTTLGGRARAADPATVTLNSPVFQDHMVLQQGMAVPIWGKGSPVGGQVAVSFNGQTKVTTVAADHTWRVDLDAMTAGGPHPLQITGKNTIVINDVLIGEVWLVSGQSNMARQWITAPVRVGYPLVRCLRTKDWEDNPAEMGWLLGRGLYDARQVPIGILNLAANGSSVREWLGEDTGADLPADVAAQVSTAGGRYYREMIAPVTPYAIRGVFWWQGESDNDPRAAFTYGDEFTALIGSWRRAFEQVDLPFVFVQLPCGRGPGPRRPSYPLPFFQPPPGFGVVLSDAYLDTLRRVPFTEMVTTKDLGHGPHPYNREPFAERMVNCARRLVYGEPVACSGPIVESATAEGDRVRIRFVPGTADGLHSIGPYPVQGFALAEEGQGFDWAQVEIDGNDVVVWNDRMARPTRVRYAWYEYPRWANLVNGEEMAASPFEMDVGNSAASAVGP